MCQKGNYMKILRSVRPPKPSSRRFAHGARLRLGLLSGAMVALSIAIASFAGSTPLSASTQAQSGQVKAKRYKATRPFVFDKQSGEVRMPTQQEVDEVVANLAALGQRPDESLQQTAQATGAVGLDLDGGFAGVLLARPNADGTWQTRCVFTLEEGAEFLGIVEDDSTKG